MKYNRHIKSFVILLAALLAAGTVKAQDAGNAAGPTIRGSVFGGGNLADVKINTEVNMSAGQVAGNVYGGGKGKADTFTCEKAMVGVNDDGVTIEGTGESATYTLKEGGTTVSISGGTIDGNVYGGGEVGRVERNAKVTIGDEDNAGSAPIVKGSVFGAGAGLVTHGYSALVRGTSSVTVMSKAQVWKNVYGGGEMASVGRYWIATTQEEATAHNVKIGMPYGLKCGGTSSVTVQGTAVIGTENDANTGHVYGSGQGIEPMTYDYASQQEGDENYNADYHKPKRMIGGNTWEYFDDKASYLQFIETLGITAVTDVDIQGSAHVRGSVFGGSESGFVYHNTDVLIQGGIIDGSAFGGGRGLATFAEAGRVSGTTSLAISGGAVKGNVYGGGNLGDVGTITKPADYNYTWKQNDGTTANATGTNAMTGTNNNTGTCTVTITGGTIGSAGAVDEQHGHVFGAGQGLDDTFWCEKAIAYSTAVSITGGTVFGNVYGGGQIGRVEDDAKVTIGGASAEARADIKGSVFGAGAGKDTHGYSALVRGDTKVTVEGYALVGHSVYGGGEKASVGRYGLNAQKMPNILVGGGNCDVDIQGHAAIGADVFGAGKGIDPVFDSSNKPRRMTVVNGESTWEPFEDEDSYFGFLETLALATHPDVTISGDATVNGSVYGGGEQGLTKGSVFVNILGGTIEKDVYGGGALANTNTTDIVADNYPTVTPTTDTDGNIVTRTVSPTTTVNLQGGLIKGDAYGGGLGRLARAAVAAQTAQGTEGEDGYVPAVEAQPAVTAVEAKVCGDITVTLGEDPNSLAGVSPRVTKFNITKYEGKEIVKSGRVFGCNNMNGSPQGNVTVKVWQTRAGNTARTAEDPENSGLANKTDAVSHTYEVAAVYGGGNLASYTAAGKKTNVIVETCDASIQYVYGGGNAAAVPQTDVLIKGAYEIENVFGGGNGMDDYTLDGGSTWITNPGANVNGNANTLLTGGYVHEAYGGSNEKGTIIGDVAIDVGTGGCCDLDLAKLVGAGKNADVNGDLKVVMGCKPETKVPLVFGGADNANVNGDVELTITSGNWGTVVGGNNNGGVIKGHIILNIEETSCIPINIDELYGCGYNALYSEYGYYVETEQTTGENATGVGAPTETAILTSAGKLHFLPRLSADDPHKPVNTYAFNETSNKWEWTVYTGEEGDVFTPYASPEVNIISCTHIGQVFGGGYGATATVYGDPKVNINMIPGDHAAKITRGEVTNAVNALGEIGNVFGGGNQAAVWGNTTVNIATKTAVQLHESISREGVYTMSEDKTVTGAYISGNVYGGGNEADVTGNTLVQVCAKEVEGVYQAVSQGTTGVLIAGNVFGGGKGKADTYKCEKAMVGTDGDGVDHPDGGTTVIIGNGTVGCTVYGGGEIGRVEKNTVVTIGIGEGVATGTATSAPVVKGNVFGAGKGLETHGYAALVRGNPTVTIQGNAKVLHSVYGGGEIASVARYQVVDGVPVALAQVKEGQHSGWCTVNVRGYAEIGPETAMKMYHEDVPEADDAPDDAGHVFAAGKGVLPENYTYANKDHRPKRMMAYDESKYTSANQADWEYSDESHKNVWEYFPNEKKYFEFIQTLALATQTSATIGGNALVKGSVYGGSENGLVQYDTNVTIKDNCQIGCGKNTTGRHLDEVWGDSYTVPDDGTDLECASWDYDGKTGAPYDPYAKYQNPADGKYYYDAEYKNYADGGAKIAKDGHTYYGNVFGGGSGSVPYFDTNKHESRYIMTAGWVKGNTHVTINGGHILTNVYGGCEATNVDGTAYVTMTRGTLGVPRTLAQIDAHPVTCYLFGAGKGDQRVFFNKDTNVKDVEVSITGGRIYGSVFGGGEDGHVLRNVTMTIGQQTTTGEGTEAVTTTSGPVIGTWGTSYVDGNVFGGGRGFGGDAYTAGNVAGSIKMEIKGGTMLGSIYGGGRLGSVGYGLFDAGVSGYGEMRLDTDTEEGFSTEGFFNKRRGHIDITISGGTIGNTHEYIVPNATNIAAAGISETDISKWTTDNEWKKWKIYHHISKTEFDTATGRLTHTKGGNVFAGGMGRFYQLDGTTPISVIDWWKLGNVKSTKLTITGGNIKSNVYGGGEQGWTSGYHTTDDGKKLSTEITISGGTIGTEVKDGEATKYTFGSVFGGGYGSSIEKLMAGSKETNPKFQAGRVKYSTKVDISGNAMVKASVYGGGEVASVGYGFYSYDNDNVIGESAISDASEAANTWVSISGNAEIGKAKEGSTYFGGATMGNVYGGGSGNRTIVRCGLILGNTNVNVKGGTIHHNIYGGGAYGSVGDFEYDTQEDPVHHTLKVYGVKSLHTSGTGTATVTITGGTVGVDGRENGMVFGSSRGDINEPGKRDDHGAWVYDTKVTIGTEGQGTTLTTPLIKGSVYGSGENGHTFHNTEVTVNSGTIGVTDDDALGGANYPFRGNVYGGGCGTDMYDSNNDGVGDKYNPLAGIVYGNATVTINGGHVVHNVYGAGAMGSVGKTTSMTKTNGDDFTIGGQSMKSGFLLSVPYRFEYPALVDGKITTGLTTVNIYGGIIGVTGTTGGDVYGAARGGVGESYEMAEFANVRQTTVNIGTGSSSPTIYGSVYGGGEDGHTMENAYVTINNGTIEQSVYGSGRGTDKYAKKLKKWEDDSEYDGEVYSLTAGKVYGNTYVEMKGGLVKGNVYGGGKLASVGKGNYSGGADDYFPAGYGETLSGNLWDGVSDDSKAFLTTGKAKVTITGGTVGTINGIDEDGRMPTGNVFGGSQGEAAPNIFNQPADDYNPVFHLANINEAEVIIGTKGQATSIETAGTADAAPHIYGSVYGGGQDGHMRRDAKVTVYSGEIGNAYTEANKTAVGTFDLSNMQWEHRGNVFGAGSGFGLYKFDYDHDGVIWTDENGNGKYDDGEEDTYEYDGVTYRDMGVSYLAGCVARFSEVNILGGIIHRNVYGGGSVAGTGEPKFGYQTYEPYKKGDTATGHGQGKQSMNTVTVSGGTIGEAGYGGNVFGASRGNETLLEADDRLTTSIWTEVNILGGTIWNDVYGGGELGTVKQDTKVNLLGGIVKGDAYGGGKGTSAVAADIGSTLTGAPNLGGNTTVNLNGLESADYAADIHSALVTDVDTSDGTYYRANDGCVIEGNVFGCNNINGTPKGHAKVHVFKTKAKTSPDGTDYDVAKVFGGGKSSDYVPDAADTKQSTEVIIEGCDLTSIEEVYGGGYGAAVPATDVLIKGTKIINNVYGGGYGAGNHDDPTASDYNPGANVGYRSDGTTVYGLADGGKAVVQLMAGNVNNVYGGSNTKGNIRNGSSITTVDKDGSEGCCAELSVKEIYGGGKVAPMEGGAEIVLGCMPEDWIGEIYAGAQQGDVGNDVSLTITSGKFGRVFGGNKDSGKIDGYIEVNIEECPTCGKPGIVIGELYGGGNLAPYIYSKIDNYPDYKSPRVNVRSFTSIGTIYGGGYGEGAEVTGNPMVNINVGMVPGGGLGYDAEDKPEGVNVYPHRKDKIGVIGNVFGGGNAAKVNGNTYVNIGTTEYEVLAGITAGESDVSGYYTRSGEGTTEDPFVYTEVMPTPPATKVLASEDTLYYIRVLGADIRGNVYGGGNNAEVTGNTNVVIGKKNN